MDRQNSVSDQILDSLAKVAAEETVERGQHLTAGFEQILLGLFKDSGISQDELRADLKKRIHNSRLERLSLELVEGGAAL